MEKQLWDRVFRRLLKALINYQLWDGARADVALDVSKHSIQ